MTTPQLVTIIGVALLLMLKIASMIIDQLQYQTNRELLVAIKEWFESGKVKHEDTQESIRKIEEKAIEADSERIPVVQKIEEMKQDLKEVPKKVVDEIKRDSSVSESGKIPTVNTAHKPAGGNV